MNDHIPALRKTFREAYENELSSFYKDLYVSKGFLPQKSFPKDLEAWKKLPFLENNDIRKYPLFQRVFTPWEKVKRIRY